MGKDKKNKFKWTDDKVKHFMNMCLNVPYAEQHFGSEAKKIDQKIQVYKTKF